MNIIVDGVSLTHGPSGYRTHIWTFAAGTSDMGNPSRFCECVIHSAPSAPEL